MKVIIKEQISNKKQKNLDDFMVLIEKKQMEASKNLTKKPLKQNITLKRNF